MQEYNAAVRAAARDSLKAFARYSRILQDSVRRNYPDELKEHGEILPWECAAAKMQWLPATVAGVEGPYLLVFFCISGRTFAMHQELLNPIYEIVLPSE